MASYLTTPLSTHLSDWQHLHLLHQGLVVRTNWKWRLKPLQEAIENFIECGDTFEAQSEIRKEYKMLRSELEASFKELQWHYHRGVPPVRTATTEEQFRSIGRELSYVQEKQDRDIPTLDAEVKDNGDDVLACYRRIQSHFHYITLAAKLDSENLTDIRRHLQRRSPELAARINFDIDDPYQAEIGPCIRGTRIGVLGQIHDWVNNPDSGSVYWINGMAGTGKTTIACSICLELISSHVPTASFFCSRWPPELRDCSLIIPSVAYQLAKCSAPFRYALSDAFKDPDLYLNTYFPDLQFDCLISRPLLEIKHALASPFVVVIDGLDECEDEEGTGQLLEVLLTKALDLPIKFIVSSRPEPQIRSPMKRQSNQATSRVILHELDRHIVQQDIKLYLKSPLGLPQPWEPTEDQVHILGERAGTLFMLAAIDLLYISRVISDEHRNAYQLENLLGSSGSEYNRGIDVMYAPILQAALDDPNLSEVDKDDMRRVLYLVACAKETLVVESISKQLEMDTNRIWAALRPLWSVLHVSEDRGTVSVLHPSFADYVLDARRSKDHCCDPKAYRKTVV
ncbi:hypothetical protein FRC11_011600 [Ceratobasidium sp. 423]|nr:hypothetical protein FRC11_011600 [Ceratobasidium sp. 423]